MSQKSISRRDLLKTTGFGALAMAASPLILAAAETKEAPKATSSFALPPLPYTHDALEPHLDAQTMQIHHTKHHQAYITNLNKALEGQADLASWSLDDLLKKLDTLPEAIRTAVRNNAGGHANHTFFWQIMKPHGGGEPSGALGDAIKKAFGDFAKFKGQFSEAAMKRFGSGWAWLVKNKEGNLKVSSTANQDSPITEGHTPLLGIDVWEHAYYLKYQNKRADYVGAWWNVINWEEVAKRFS